MSSKRWIPPPSGGSDFEAFLARQRKEKIKEKARFEKSGEIEDETQAYDSLSKDLIGGDDSGSEDDDDYGKRGKKKDPRGDDEEKPPDFMFFDFRKGSDFFPSNCEIIDPSRAEVLLEKQTTIAEEALKLKKSDKADDPADDGEAKGGEKVAVSWHGAGGDDDSEEYDAKAQVQEATFEVLQDGSYALVMKPGYRLKLNLQELLQGGDAAREERAKKAAKAKKTASRYSTGV